MVLVTERRVGLRSEKPVWRFDYGSKLAQQP
jgi:hypothetical protein